MKKLTNVNNSIFYGKVTLFSFNIYPFTGIRGGVEIGMGRPLVMIVVPHIGKCKVELLVIFTKLIRIWFEP